MDAWVWIVIVVVALALLGFVAWTLVTKRRTDQLQSRFGPEYERTVEQAETRREAESELSARMKHRKELEIQPVSTETADRYAHAWRDERGRERCRPARHAFDAGARLSDGRLRTAGGGRFRGSSERGRKLPRRPYGVDRERAGQGGHGRPPPSDGPLPIPVRGALGARDPRGRTAGGPLMTERREELREEFSSEDVVRVPENEDGGHEARPEVESQADVAAEGGGEVAEVSETEVPPSDDEGGAAALLADEDAGGFRSRWNEIQVRFVDEPRGSVQKADGLVA